MNFSAVILFFVTTLCFTIGVTGHIHMYCHSRRVHLAPGAAYKGLLVQVHGHVYIRKIEYTLITTCMLSFFEHSNVVFVVLGPSSAKCCMFLEKLHLDAQIS